MEREQPARPADRDAPALAVRKLTVRYPGQDEPVIRELSLDVPAGAVTAMIGPNGSGKSTLLKTIARQLRAERGRVLLGGRDTAEMSGRALAREMAMLFQENTAPGGLSVESLVYHGRHPHRKMLRPLTEADHEAVEQAIGLTGVGPLRQRDVSRLSGGQKQMVWIAMALAQEPGVLLLDEPTTFLDLRHQLEVMQLIEALRDRGMTVLVVLHDVNQAARHADRLVALRAGEVAAAGRPEEVVTAELLREVFGVRAEVVGDAAGSPVCLPRAVAAR